MVVIRPEEERTHLSSMHLAGIIATGTLPTASEPETFPPPIAPILHSLWRPRPVFRKPMPRRG